MKIRTNRRNFLKQSSALPLYLSAARAAGTSGATAIPDLRQEIGKYRKLDAYGTAPLPMDWIEKLHIGKTFVGGPMLWKQWTPAEFRAANDEMLALMKRFPGKVVGQISVNPLYLKESLEEIDRCAAQGMVGTRLYYQAKINDPVYFPVIEKLIGLKMIIFMHGEAQIGVGGYRMKYDAGRPATISRPDDFADAARRYPEAVFQFAHLGGGGDWEYMCKCLAPFPNVFIDVGGSNNEAGMIDFAAAHLGAGRLLFGSDGSYPQAIGRILSSSLPEKEKQMIFYDNYAAILKKGGYHAD